ncbi:DUF3857 domain-containing protein [Lutibacter sp. B1]|uniref:DUF3857 domain-containing protein n=1 Tax=Lutibacter sp. B1 TaxID=2725996 RepID=UPI0014564F00|nr:DUF3857 domain-containing protein [Lutibacter sp. B1]NLP58848.1 DUF3857 domain-containing protein [Lutibacter sp. B1]
MKKVLITLSFVLVTSFIFSQDYRLGKVSKEELQEKYYPLDSSANAAVLYKKSKTYYTYNEQLGWTLITEVHERIKIYNKEGYDWATKKITLYAEDEQEKLTIKAYTYNLEKGKIEKIKLKNGDIFSENMNKYWNATKFTMPNLTEGCVVEWEYTIRSPYYWHIDEIQIQYKIPVKFIEAQVTTPDFFVFKNQTKGYIPFNINKTQKQSSMVFLNKRRESNGYVEKTSFNQEKVTYVSNVLEFQLNDVPAIIEEPYVNNIDNYTSSLKFELTAYTPKYDTHKYYNTTWEDVTKKLFIKVLILGKNLKSHHILKMI